MAVRNLSLLKKVKTMFETVHDITFHIDLQGPVKGPGLVLLHSLGTNLHLWDPQISALSRQYRVLRIDMRGHGLTTTGASSFTIRDLAGDVLTLTGRFGLRHFSVAGVSIGGMIAQQLADDAPERLDAIIMIATTSLPLSPAIWRARTREVRERGIGHLVDDIVSRWVTPDFADTPQASALRSMLHRTDAEGYARCAEALTQVDLRKPVTTEIPALVVAGKNDLSIPLVAARDLATVRSAQLTELPGAAHIPNFEQPEALARVILDFLEERSRIAHQPTTTQRSEP
jgi:3-oxoadipate enol-lactonase